jgi:hypothetical protein
VNFQLSFDQLLKYDAGQPGITIDVALKLIRDEVPCTTKLDTGSTFCIFTRQVGGELGLVVEDGLERVVRTVTGTFVVYLHEVTLLVLGVELDALVGFAADDFFQRQVLGRRGFLDQIVLGLVDYEGQLYLSRYQ